MTEGTRASDDALKEWDEESKLFVEVVDVSCSPVSYLLTFPGNFGRHADKSFSPMDRRVQEARPYHEDLCLQRMEVPGA